MNNTLSSITKKDLKPCNLNQDSSAFLCVTLLFSVLRRKRSNVLHIKTFDLSGTAAPTAKHPLRK
jgi:hypothetical protein